MEANTFLLLLKVNKRLDYLRCWQSQENTHWSCNISIFTHALTQELDDKEVRGQKEAKGTFLKEGENLRWEGSKCSNMEHVFQLSDETVSFSGSAFSLQTPAVCGKEKLRLSGQTWNVRVSVCEEHGDSWVLRGATFTRNKTLFKSATLHMI